MSTLADIWVEVGAKINAGAESSVKTQLRALGDTKITPKVSLPDMGPEVRALQNRLKILERDQIRVNLDTKTAGAEVASLEKSLDRLKAERVNVPVTLADAADKQIAKVEADLAKAQRRETTLPVKLETVTAKITALRGELAKVARPVNVPVEVSTPTLRQKLAAARKVITGTLEDKPTMSRSGTKSAENFEGGFAHRMKELSGEAARALIGGFIAVGSIEVFRHLMEQGERAEKTLLLTESVLKSTGEAAGVTADDVDKLTLSLSRKTGTDETVVRNGENLLLTFTGIRNEVGKGNDIFNQATATALNMSAALGQDMKASAIQLGKALQDPVKGATALRRVGVALTEQQKDQIKAFVASGRTLDAQKVILRELGTEFGGAAEAAATPLDKLKSTVNSVAMAAGEHLLPTVGKISDAVSVFVQDFQDGVGAGGRFRNELESLGGVLHGVWDAFKGVLPLLGDVAGVIGGTLFASTKSLTAGIVALTTVMVARKVVEWSSSLEGLAERLAGLGGAGTSAGVRLLSFSSGLGRVASFLGGPWGIALGIGVTALVGFATHQSETAKAAKELTDQLTYQDGKLDENSRSVLANSLAKSGALDAAHRAGIGEKEYTSAIIDGGDARTSMVAQLQDIIDKHTSSYYSGGQFIHQQDDMAKAATTAKDALQENADTIDTGTHRSKEATAALGEQAGATQEAGGKAKDMVKATTDLTNAETNLRNVVQQVIDKFTILKQGGLDQERANEAWAAAVDAATAAVKTNGHTLDLNTSKGRANRSALVDMINALNDKVTADFKHAYSTSKSTSETGKLSDALKVAQADMASGKKTIDQSAFAAGHNRGEVDKMIGTMLKTPKQLKTDVKTNAQEAEDKFRHLQGYLHGMTGKTVDLDIKFRMAASKAAADVFKHMPGSQASGLVGLRPGFGGGGKVLGWSPTKTADNIVAKLTAREWVQPVDSVDYYGPAVMKGIQHRMIDRDALRSLAPQGLAAGGQASYTYTPKVWPRMPTVGPATASHAADVLRSGTAQTLAREIASINSQLFSGLINNSYVQAAMSKVGTSYAIGMCLQFVRTLLGAPGGPPTAMAGWNTARYKHPGDKNPPAGAPVWWGGGLGHVAEYVGQGKIVSTDLPRSGRVGLVPFMAPSTVWGKPYLGWTGDIDGKVLQFGSARGGAASDVVAGGSLHRMAQQLLQNRGWNNQFPALDYIISHESGWNVHARNASSGAYGLGQALPASKMAPFGSDFRDSANTQLRWMLAYIGSRYGDPDRAASFWRAHHWYGGGGQVGLADGALVRGGMGGVTARIGEGSRDELVTPLPKGWQNGQQAQPRQMAQPYRGPLVNVEHVESTVDLEAFAKAAEFRERMCSFT